MAAPGDATGPRFVGTVVDPSLLDGGETEPEVHLAPASAPIAAAKPDAGAEPLTAAASDKPDAVAEPPTAAAFSGDSPPVSASVSAPVSAAPESEVSGFGGSPGDELPPRRGAELRAHLLSRARRGDSALGSSPVNPHVEAGLDGIDPGGAPPATARELELSRLARGRMPVAAVPVAGGLGGGLSPNMTALLGTLLGLAGVASIVALAMHLDRRLPQAGPAPSVSATTSAGAEVVASAAPAPAAPRRERKSLPGPWRVADEREKPGLRLLRGTIGKEPFLRVIQEAGVKTAEAYRVLKAFEGVRDFDKCGRSDTFVALVERGSGRMKGFEYVVSPEEVYQAREGDDGLLRAARLDLKVEYGSFQGAFVVDGAIDASAVAAGFEPGLRDALAKALVGHLDVGAIERGDRVRVIVQEVTVLGAFARYAGIEALEIVPRDPKRTQQRFYYFKGATERGYYDAKGRSPYEGGWRNPVPGAPITSHFNPNRLHPVLKKRMPHNGTDYGAPTGTPVHASSYGKVSFVGWGGPAGNLVRIDHAGGIETLYFHLSRFEAGLKAGDSVARMQVIGYVGSTGRSTGPHLHFGVKRDGKYIDAMTLKLDALRVISSQEREAFAAAVQRYDELLDALPLPPVPTATAAAPTPSASAEAAIGDEEMDAMEAVTAEAAPADAKGAPNAPVTAPVAPGTGAAAAVFLSDKELLELQGATNDGEVDP